MTIYGNEKRKSGKKRILPRISEQIKEAKAHCDEITKILPLEYIHPLDRTPNPMIESYFNELIDRILPIALVMGFISFGMLIGSSMR